MKQVLFDSHLHSDRFITKKLLRQIDRSRVIPAESPSPSPSPEKSKISKNKKKWRNSNK